MSAGQYDEACDLFYERINKATYYQLGAFRIDMARLSRDQGEAGEARRLAEEALTITERCGYVLQGADGHLVLAQLALDAGDRTAARYHARQARALATCDGPPDYTYKVAYDEAGVLLEELEE